MNILDFLSKLQHEPENISFADTTAVIGQQYHYTPSSFKNGDIQNEAGTNEGSCKLFAFAKLQGFSETQTLACFGDYYRKDVLENPEAKNHANIRNFMTSGWQGIEFDLAPEKILAAK